MEENWRDVVDYEGLYQVSDRGRVKSLSRLVEAKANSYRLAKEIILKPNKVKGGYQAVTLRKDNTPKTFKIHRLELLAFKGLPTEGKDVGMHLDDNPTNNDLSNLAWGSNSDNMRQAFDRGRKSSPKYWVGKTGAAHATSKKIIQFDNAGNEVRSFTGIYEAHRQTKVNRSSISACCLGKRNFAGGFIWRYAS